MKSTIFQNLSRINASPNKREACKEAAFNFFASASEQAEAGDLQRAGTLILKALDQERRAGLGGVQVLQLIKPR